MMPDHLSHHRKYPQLYGLYCNTFSTTKTLTPKDSFILKTSELISTEPSPITVEEWCTSLRQYVMTLGSHTSWYLDIDQDFLLLEVPFFDLMSDIAIIAITACSTASFIDLMSLSADKTSLVSFRFIAAWTALNTDSFDRCIEECEKVDTPFSALHTVHGQALLESGNTQEAIQILRIAVAISPKEILAWFQLAKAFHILEDYENSWDALTRCDELSRGNIEVAVLMAIVVLTDGRELIADRLEYAWKALSCHVAMCSRNVAIISFLVDLALRVPDQDKLRWIIDSFDLQELAGDRELLRVLTKLLKKLQQLQWHEIATSLLDKVSKKGA